MGANVSHVGWLNFLWLIPVAVVSLVASILSSDVSALVDVTAIMTSPCEMSASIFKSTWLNWAHILAAFFIPVHRTVTVIG
jgi:hypothetical protein